MSLMFPPPPLPEKLPPGMRDFRPPDSELGRYTVKKLGDDFLAQWEQADLPDDAVVTRVTVMLYRGDRPVFAWRDGRGWLPEGDVQAGEDAATAVRRIAEEQAGATDLQLYRIGHWRLRATHLNKTQPADTITYRNVYVAEVGGLLDFPTDKAYERRIVRQRDLNELLRTTYHEMRREYTEALDYFLLQRLKAQAAEEGAASAT